MMLKLNYKISVLLVFFALVICWKDSYAQSFYESEDVQELIKRGALVREYYTTHTIYTDRQVFLPANYHTGDVLVLNSLVRIDRLTPDSIQFHPVNSSEKFFIFYEKKYSELSFLKFFQRYFSELPTSLEGFSQMETDNIMHGTIEEGMSKDAVILAYGYPPVTKTPYLEMDTWRYWIHRWKSINVHFQNGKVSSVDS